MTRILLPTLIALLVLIAAPSVTKIFIREVFDQLRRHG